MRILLAIAACTCLCLLPVSAGAQTYSSDQYGFTAVFPADPVVGAPQAAESDAKGNTISKSVIIQARVMGVYTAMVTVETYVRPAKIDAGTTLVAMPKLFVGQLDATMTSSKPGKLDGYRARFFSYETSDKSSSGKGIAVVVPGKLPRTYLVLTNYTSLASDENKAALEAFLASFHIK